MLECPHINHRGGLGIVVAKGLAHGDQAGAAADTFDIRARESLRCFGQNIKINVGGQR